MTWILAGLAAAAVAILATVLIERFGGRLGGLLATLPTTIVPATVGLWGRSADAGVFADALFAVPAGMLVNALFLVVWRVAPRWLPGWSLGLRLAAICLISLTVWGLAAAATLALLEGLRADGSLLAVGWLTTLGIAAAGAAACRGAVPAPRGSRGVPLAVLLSRGLFAGLAVGAAVWLVDVAGPMLAGLASVFPAIFLTTMVSLWLAQGEAVPAGAVGPMILGSTSVALFAMLAAHTVPALGVAPGCGVAWLLSAGLVNWPAWALWLRRQPEALSAAD